MPLRKQAHKSSSFITLKLGRGACQRLLRTAEPATLGWIKSNTLLWTQAQTITQQYLKERTAEPANFEVAPSHARSSDDNRGGGGHVILRLHPAMISAASHAEPADDGDKNTDANSKAQPPTPSAQAQRTPSIKLSFGKVKPAPTVAAPRAHTPSEDGGSSKKRKRAAPSDDPDPASAPKVKAPQLLKLVTKHGPSTLKNSAITPGIKLKTKGKIPKRPTGVGYDSELEDREIDPVILEAFVLRMLPGDDCNYIRDAIANGTVGVSILQKGADIRMRVLDVNGRRGILQVRGRQYAFTIVDLPTVTEGMKSWDKKNFIKSVDISQMCLVLGPCKTDEEARTYPLPSDVNPKNYQYAHGLTAPMRNVRKRRFERTARARLDDIEAIERKVNSLLEADSKASHTSYEVLDHDPRAEEDEYSAEEGYDSDEDAEAEDEDGYFLQQNGAAQTPEQQYRPEEISALEALFEQGVEEADYAPDTDTAATTAAPSLQPGSANPLSSSAASPLPGEISAFSTDTPAAPDDDDEGPDEDEDVDADADASDADQEASDEKAETLAKIKEAEDKIARQKEQLRGTSNQILKKKIAKKIQDLDSDIRMMMRHAGLVADREDGEGDEDGGAGGGGGGGGGVGLVQKGGGGLRGGGGGEESGSEEE